MTKRNMFKCVECKKQSPLPARRNEIGQPICVACLKNIMQFLKELENEKKQTGQITVNCKAFHCD